MTVKMTHEMIERHMRLNGFSKSEARQISRAEKNQYSHERQDADVLWRSGLIQKAIRSRRNWIENCRSIGWTDDEIRRGIMAFSRGHETKSDAFLFLKFEYGIPDVTSISNYQLSLRLRERDRINRVARVFGVRYGRKQPVLRKPKPELFVRQPEDNFMGIPKKKTE
jgi:hypothetical protein